MDADILYRWDKKEAGIPDPTRSAQANEIVASINAKYPECSGTVKITAVKFPIQSDPRKQISNREYLSESMGVGGHIVGFLRYKNLQERGNPLQYTTFQSSQIVFRNLNHPHLFVIPGSGIEKVRNNLYSITHAGLDDTITTCPNVLKFTCLGCLMPAPQTNTAEIDFVGNGVSLEGYMIEFEQDEEEEEEDEEDEPPRKKGGMKRSRDDCERMIRTDFSTILNEISVRDSIRSRGLVFPNIAFDECPAAGGRRKTKKIKKHKRKTIRKRL